MIVQSKSGIWKSRVLVKDAVLRLKNAKSRIVLGLVMSVTMATLLSFVITISYTGFSPHFLSIWINRLALSLSVGPPIGLLLLPIATKLVGKILREQRRNIPL